MHSYKEEFSVLLKPDARLLIWPLKKQLTSLHLKKYQQRLQIFVRRKVHTTLNFIRGYLQFINSSKF